MSERAGGRGKRELGKGLGRAGSLPVQDGAAERQGDVQALTDLEEQGEDDVRVLDDRHRPGRRDLADGSMSQRNLRGLN